MKVIDIGMYDGADTAYYLSCGHRVIAIEANPRLCERAEQRFASQIQSGALTILNIAIAPGDFVELTVSGQDLGSSSIHPELVANRSPAGSYRVKAATLPNVIREHGQPDFIKIDIEGADRDCVLSITREIAPRYLSFEAPADIADLIDHLVSVGFTRFKAIHQPSFRALNRQECLRDRIARKIIRTLGYDEPRIARRCGYAFVLEHSAGPPPWESDGKFKSSNALIAEWNSARQLNRLSAWYDIHVCR